MMRCTFIVFICLLCWPRFSAAQERVYRERLHVNTDQDTYLAGEWCWLSVYSIDAVQNQIRDFSKIAYVELMDARGNALAQGKIALSQGKGNGALQLGADIPTGTYTLRAYTRWMRNFGAAGFYTQEVNVINTLHPIDNDGLHPLFSDKGIADAGITCTVDKAVVSKRSPVNIDVHLLKGWKTPLTLSVYRLDTNLVLGPSMTPAVNYASLPLIDTLLPELKGNIVTGRIVNKSNGLPAKDGIGTLSIPGKKPYLYAVESNEQGRFTTEIVGYYGNSTLLMESEDKEHTVSLDYNFAPAGAVKDAAPRDTFPESAMEAYSTRHIAAQVQNAYHERELALLRTLPTDSTYFFGKPDEEVLLDEYTRFTTMEEVFREVVKLVMVRRGDKQLHMHVWDIGRDIMLLDDALVLLDGVPIYDNKKLFDYDPLKIRKVSVKARTYAYQSLGAAGIVCLQTYSGDLKDYPLDAATAATDYIGLQAPHPFYAPAYATEADQRSRMPDYRTLLYWQPDLLFNEKGEASAHFYTGDIPGHYQVVAAGIDAAGKPCYTTQTFEVR